MSNIEAKLRQELKGAVRRNQADGILLSGGLDSSILAYLSPNITAFTVFLKSSGGDRRYVAKIVQYLGLEHHQKEISVEEAIEEIPKVIKILRTFDPAIPNDLAIYFGMKLAREKGVKSIMTGDGGDELFAGYSYMFKLNLNEYIPRIARTMYFSSQDIGKAIGLTVKQPYMDKKFVEFALSIKPELKVGYSLRGSPAVRSGRGGKDWRTFGKWILRKAYENCLPGEIIWQGKRPIEKGSGFTRLREILKSKISDETFKEKSKVYPIKFINKEHMYYYEIYKKVVGDIPKPGKGEIDCPGCGAGILREALHCQVCGRT